MLKSILKLGTRRSLLAWAQSSWVAREVERLNPGIRVELVGIDTRGDQIQDVPLQKVEGKDFFVAELDHSLLEGRVDFTVHSLKDLSLTRPPGLICSAIPRRENPRDVILFGPKILGRLKSGETLRIGTSSPRRLENVPAFLQKALPRLSHVPGASCSLEFVEIRGNVNTRLSRVHEVESAPKYLDGVVLAFAGLIRLWADPIGKVELERLLQDVKWMILPLEQNPAAPGQGALAIECRADDAQTRELLKKLDDRQTGIDVGVERELLAESGGGCHQRFGATQVASPFGPVMWIKGKMPQGESVQHIRWTPPSRSAFPIRGWDGSQWRLEQELHDMDLELDLAEGASQSRELSAVFVAHARAAQGSRASQWEGVRVWTSGTASWFKLARMGIWVEGCAEGLGFEALIPSLREPVLRLPSLVNWKVFTHFGAHADWLKLGMLPVPTYRIRAQYGQEARSQLQQATHVFWSSGSQLNELKDHVSQDVRHACGPGKTADRLRELGIEPDIFPKVEEWRKWIKG